MNEEIVEKIAKIAGSGEESEQTGKSSETWLVFSIAGKQYALRSADVHEIIRDVPVYKLPFLPPYVEGVINRRGDPFTVINPLAIIGEQNAEPPEEPLFLILKRDDDQISLHISDILFFTERSETELNLIPTKSDEESFFIGTFSYDSEQIPVLNPNAFESLIRKDLGSA